MERVKGPRTSELTRSLEESIIEGLTQEPGSGYEVRVKGFGVQGL